MIKRILLAGFSIYGGSPGATTPLPPQCNPARQAFYVMRNRNFLLQKNTACQAVFTALTSGIEVLNEMSVKRSFDTHFIPGLLRSYAAPAILQIFEIR